MRRAVLLLVWLPLLAFGQEPKKAASTVPADRRVDTYAVYSIVLAHPSLSHPDNNEKYLVDELSGFAMENEPQSCITVPKRTAPTSLSFWRIAPSTTWNGSG
jgi:hypothetical protein